jgi:hypothetical protein
VEISGRSGKKLALFVLNCGKTGKHQEETTKLQRDHKRQKTPLKALDDQAVVFFVALPVATLWQFSSKIYFLQFMVVS